MLCLFSNSTFVFPSLKQPFQNQLFNCGGFSLVSVLITAGASSFVLLALAKSQLFLIKNTQRIESKMVALELTKEIISTLEAPAPDCKPPTCTWSKSSCTNTLKGFNDVAGVETTKTAILSATQTSQPNPSEMYSTGMSYNGVSIKEMKVVTDKTGDGIVTLKLWFETDEDASRGVTSPEMSRAFDIYVKVNYVSGSNKVESCIGVISSFSTFRGKVCGDNEYLKGFDNTGIMECVRLPECADDEYLKGFDSNGKEVCLNRSALIADQACPPGSYLSGFDSSGNKVCHPRCTYGWSENCQRCKRRCQTIIPLPEGVIIERHYKYKNIHFPYKHLNHQLRLVKAGEGVIGGLPKDFGSYSPHSIFWWDDPICRCDGEPIEYVDPNPMDPTDEP